jgi:hypothetical protein
MALYQNIGGRSSISSYDLGKGFLRVYFKEGGSYTYTTASVGQETLNEMIELAKSGQGLNGYINLNVKEDFDDTHDFE